MDTKEIYKLISERYISPTDGKKTKMVGIELELPILNLKRAPVDTAFVHRAAEEFAGKFGFTAVRRDDNGDVYLYEEKSTGDSLSFDCSYNNIELSMGCGRDLHEIRDRFGLYYTQLTGSLMRGDHMLTGMGVNPYRDYNNNVPIPTGRYRMLYHHLHSYPLYQKVPMHFHHYPAFGTFSSASQVQLDVSRDEILKTIRAFTRTEPVKALLFSNSVLLGEMEDMICARDMFWENSTHGINPHNVGMFECDLYSESELIDYIASTSIYCVERGNRYINFEPVQILEYFNREGVTGEYYDNEEGAYKRIEVTPEPGDINYLRTFKFEDLTFRGTIEFRSCCAQPLRDTMTVGAFHLGLQQKLDELDELLENDNILYHHGYTPNELRHLFVRRKYPAYLELEKLAGLAEDILKLAREGLRDRGFGEEIYLDPLFERINRRRNPAIDMLEAVRSGRSLEEIIEDYSLWP